MLLWDIIERLSSTTAHDTSVCAVESRATPSGAAQTRLPTASAADALDAGHRWMTQEEFTSLEGDIRASLGAIRERPRCTRVRALSRADSRIIRIEAGC